MVCMVFRDVSGLCCSAGQTLVLFPAFVWNGVTLSVESLSFLSILPAAVLRVFPTTHVSVGML